MDQHRVVATELNLRSEPLVRPGNRLAVLPRGELVEKLAESETEGWWRVRTELGGVALEGFVSARHLAPAAAAPPPGAVRAIAAVHLAEGRPEVRRGRASGRTFPIGEPGRPPPPSGRFARRRTFDLDELQAAANAGRVTVIAAQRVDPNRSGRIQIVAPEHGERAARRADGRVSLPLQSQAGARTFRFGFLGTTRWWTAAPFREHGLGINP